jgi:hypothetical protein
VILETFYHWLIHHSVNLNQELQEGKSEICRLGPTCNLGEEALQNSHDKK